MIRNAAAAAGGVNHDRGGDSGEGRWWSHVCFCACGAAAIPALLRPPPSRRGAPGCGRTPDTPQHAAACGHGHEPGCTDPWPCAPPAAVGLPRGEPRGYSGGFDMQHAAWECRGDTRTEEQGFASIDLCMPMTSIHHLRECMTGTSTARPRPMGRRRALAEPDLAAGGRGRAPVLSRGSNAQWEGRP